MAKNPTMDLITKRLRSFAKEAAKDAAAYDRLGRDDDSYDAAALAVNADALIAGLKGGTTPDESDYASYAGPDPDGMQDLLEKPLTPEVAEAWLKAATAALEEIV